MSLKVAYIHGRLGPHIMHGRLAKSVGGEFHMVDAHKRWNDGEYSKLYIIYAWIYNAFAFKKPDKFDLFLVSGPHFSPVIMKLFRLRRRQRILAHLGDETMYFLFAGRYSRLMTKVLKFLLNQYDALLCEGAMAAELARLNGINKPKVYTTYLGVPKERQITLSSLSPNLGSNHFAFISTGPRGWRTYYKGIDLMIRIFDQLYQKDPSVEFTIIGEWDAKVQEELLAECSDSSKQAIHFIGRTQEIERYLQNAAFYFHTSRGDAFPTVVLEAMSAGLIPLVSEWTGSKEVVQDISPSLVVDLDEQKIVESLERLISLSIEERKALSERSRAVAAKFTEEFALEHYQKTFKQIEKDLYKS